MTILAWLLRIPASGRLAPRSLVASVGFIGFAITTVTLVRHFREGF